MMNTPLKQPVPFSCATASQLLDSFAAPGFNIPIYQRLYDWTSKEIEKMLSDFYDAYSASRTYYIGNITLNYNQETHYLDIIDGQQRLTTLWLIGLVLNLNRFSRWHSFLTIDNRTLLKFTARERDSAYLLELSRRATIEDIYMIEEKGVNPSMRSAIKTIIRFFKSGFKGSLEAFSSFIFSDIKMIAIFLPDNIDLNKYFEDMNNRGLQLEAHHIVKANLLSTLSTARPIAAFAEIWDAISQMNSYVEYGFKGDLKPIRSFLLDRKTAFRNLISRQTSATVQNGRLEDLVNRAINEDLTDDKQAVDKRFADRVTSVINFPEFLLHCLKIYLEGRADNVSVDDKQLLNEFTRLAHLIDAEEFIEFLFNCRVLFDEFIIKSVERGTMGNPGHQRSERRGFATPAPS